MSAVLLGPLIRTVLAGSAPWRAAVQVNRSVVNCWLLTRAMCTGGSSVASRLRPGPLATTSELAAGGEEAGFGLDQGVLLGTIAGALLAALLSGTFRIEGFRTAGAAPLWRYVSGAVLMGFGGILAVGCTIGAGFTGGSVLAISSLAGLASMIGAAAISGRLLDGKAASPAPAVLAPAE